MTDARIANIGQSVDVALDQTILSAALETGIGDPHGCRSGRRGSCVVRGTE